MKNCVLAFSGGLDTSYCVLKLRDEGFRVTTYYVHSGAADPEAEAKIAARAEELGADDHLTEDASGELWSDIVVPFLAGGARRQGRYPVLCADRSIIAKRGVAIADRLGADVIAHGCTGMGNDQVRFETELRARSDRPILAPIRDIQDRDNVRAYEEDYLASRGFSVPERASLFSVNENLLGATLSGGAIDRWEEPPEEARVFTARPGEEPGEPLRLTIGFREGVPVALDGEALNGPEMLRTLNEKLGAYGVGYGIYTGDTLVGLKGRIVFEAPGLEGLEAAHTALCEAVSSRAQNGFRRKVGEAWCDLVYDGFTADALRDDLEAYLRSSQARVTGEVDLVARPGRVDAVAVRTRHIPERKGAVYAQKAAWSGKAAEGFTELFGQSTVLHAKAGGGDDGAA
ncbi:argininosuccinate synthase domain-containing protein [Parvularcula lutaonensis]|uniref:argininosuccinate synthase n=1 Tax=Parvularcula lutaonensis TaxID=491923 RepID=A0ABV7M6W2_9PROT|nr:argininosuccinate synthase domain-containing protein [Parvularcula lutaonensis]